MHSFILSIENDYPVEKMNGNDWNCYASSQLLLASYSTAGYHQLDSRQSYHHFWFDEVDNPFKSGKRASMIGVFASMPLIIHPINDFVHAVMDSTVRSRWGDYSQC